MRYAEGLLEYSRNKELFRRNDSAPKITDDFGRTFVDDKLLVNYNSKTVPVFQGFDLSEEELKTATLHVFKQ